MSTKTPQSDLPNIGAPATRALTHEGYTTLKQLTKLSEAELAQLHGVGEKAIRILHEALKAKGWSFKPAKTGETLKKKGSPVSRTDAVDKFMLGLSHPLKAEVEAVRSIIKDADKNIHEKSALESAVVQLQWRVFGDVQFARRKTIHLVFYNPMIPKVKSDLLEGDYKDRRMMYLANMKDVRAKKAELERGIKQLIKLIRKTVPQVELEVFVAFQKNLRDVHVQEKPCHKNISRFAARAKII
ncbi:MAG: hypothetical protein U0X87_06925 [Anaerolineales bacterium]